MARCKDCIHDKVCNMWAVDSGIPFVNADTCEHFKSTPDVAPKSEVDRAYQRGFERGKKDNVCGFSAEDIAQKGEQLAIELEAMRTSANSYKMHYENARVEVAREIFEEIEKLSYRFMNDKHYIFGDMVWDIAELKKEYTEGE